MAPFNERLDGLIISANDAYTSMRKNGAAPWYRMSPANPDVHQEVSDSFSRDVPEKEYNPAVDDLGQVRSMQAAKLQNDMLAALERDYRMRHRSRVRMMAHATARLATHGQPAGPLGRVDMFISRLKKQASAAAPVGDFSAPAGNLA